jgi:HSP20 family molecular chaperone IbpA
MAVAGFAKQDIELTLEDNKLKIAGKVEGDDAVTEEYLHKGISARPLQR